MADTLYLCVGTGRDGTQSLTKMIKMLFESEGCNRTVAHEYAARDFYQNYCDYQETQEEHFLSEIDRVIGDCSVDCIVGNGYAPLIERFRKTQSRDVKLIHLKRQNREDCIKSLCSDSRDFPEAYRYYSSNDPTHMSRYTAFHFGDLSHEEWFSLDLRQRFGWYYDRTHALIELGKRHCSRVLEIATEDLLLEETKHNLCEFLGLPIVDVPNVWVNRGIGDDIPGITPDLRSTLQWYFRSLDYMEIAKSPVVYLSSVITMYERWLRHQSEGSAPEEFYWARQLEKDEITFALDEAANLLGHALLSVENLQKNRKERLKSDSNQQVEPVKSDAES